MAPGDKESLNGTGLGDAADFCALYHRYADLLFAYILHRLGKDRVDAEEVWQETWVAAVETAAGFRGRSTVFTWLCAIANNKIADHYRRMSRELQVSRINTLPVDMDSAELDGEQIDEDTRATVVAVLAALSDEYRNLLIEKYIDHMGITEIALGIGKSYKATESLLTRAREAFKKRFKQLVQT